MPRLARLLPLTGTLAGALFLAAFATYGDIPQDSDATLLEFYADPDTTGRFQLFFALLLASGIALVAFGAELYRRVTAPGTVASGAATVGVAGFTVAAGLFGVAGAFGFAPHLAFDEIDGFALDRSTMEIFSQLDWLLVNAAWSVAGVAIFAFARALRRAGAAPAWLCWFGLVAGALLPLTFWLFVPLPLGAAWLLAAGITLSLRGERPAGPTRAEAPRAA